MPITNVDFSTEAYDQRDLNQRKHLTYVGSINFNIKSGKIVQNLGQVNMTLKRGHLYESSFTNDKIIVAPTIDFYTKDGQIEDNCGWPKIGCNLLNFVWMKHSFTQEDIIGYKKPSCNMGSATFYKKRMLDTVKDRIVEIEDDKIRL